MLPGSLPGVECQLLGRPTNPRRTGLGYARPRASISEPNLPAPTASQRRVRRIVLLEEPIDVRPPDRMIYSTRPKKGLGEDGVEYYLKGPDHAVVAAEALAYELASLVGLCPITDCAKFGGWASFSPVGRFGCARPWRRS